MLSAAARVALGLLVPPLCAICCAACARDELLCGRCERSLAVARPGHVAVAGIEAVLAAAPYRGIAAGLIGALKFGRRPALAGRAAAAIVAAGGGAIGSGALVPVPPAPARLRGRGFDPAEAIAAELGELLGLPLAPCLARDDGPRQVGRRRALRIADPPRVRLAGEAPVRAVLVDDVVTTGATLAACARALAAGGCRQVGGLAFARSVGGRAGRDSLGVRRSDA